MPGRARRVALVVCVALTGLSGPVFGVGAAAAAGLETAGPAAAGRVATAVAELGTGGRVATAVAAADGGPGIPQWQSVLTEDASAVAARSGKRVEIPALMTGTDRVWMTPEGSMARQMFGSPVRVRRDGAWVPVDPTLVAGAKGWWKPRAAVADVALSGSASGAAARVVVGSASVEFGTVGRRAGIARVADASVMWSSGQVLTADKLGVTTSWPVKLSKALGKGKSLGSFAAGVRGAKWVPLGKSGGVNRPRFDAASFRVGKDANHVRDPSS